MRGDTWCCLLKKRLVSRLVIVFYIFGYLIVRRRDMDRFAAHELDPACLSAFLCVVVFILLSFDDMRDIINRYENSCVIINSHVFHAKHKVVFLKCVSLPQPSKKVDSRSGRK